MKNSENTCRNFDTRYMRLVAKNGDHLCLSFKGPGQGLVQGMVQLVNTRVIPWFGTFIQPIDESLHP